MSTQVLIMFPYSGFEEGDKRETLFWQLVDYCQDAVQKKPIVVLNRDTERREKAKAFLGNPRSTEDVCIHRCWAVDTCQMWLSGWGLILDEPEINDDDRIVQLPGDIDTVTGDKFFPSLDAFINQGGNHDIVIGDFASEDIFNAKELIDLYGTYALMANWFPDVAQACRQDPSKVLEQGKTTQKRFFKLNRFRSEFLNIRVGTLNSLLKVRKFAYEQTLNMLIRSWDHAKKDWKYKITKMDLGIVSDDSSFRKYQDCLDQIERTERMLKLLWREIYETRYPNQQDFIDEYDQLDRRSTSIRENARIIIRNILGLAPR
jgi:hypothetical protein